MVITGSNFLNHRFARVGFLPDDAAITPAASLPFIGRGKSSKKDSCLCFNKPSTCLALAVWEEMHEGG